MSTTNSGALAKKAFAQEQFGELLERGFSRRAAGNIMRRIGPALAMRCVEWVIANWAVTAEGAEDEYTRGLASADADDAAYAQEVLDAGMTPDLIREHMYRLSDYVHSVPGQSTSDAIKHYRSILEIYHLLPPDGEDWEVLKMIDGASVVVRYLPLREK